MINTIRDLVIVNLYWFSLPAIGFSILYIIRYLKIVPKSIKIVATFALKQYALIIFLLSFVITVFIFAILSIFFYIFKLPVSPLVIIYIILLAASIICIITLLFRNNFIKHSIRKFKDKSLIIKLFIVIFIILLVADFSIGLYAGGFIWGDATYHMSRVLDIIRSGFNIQSSFHSSLPEGAYHYNVIYSLYAVPAKMFNMAPMLVWRYSLSFFRLAGLLSVFTLSVNVLNRWLKLGKYVKPLSLLSVISAMLFFSEWGYIANYPNKIVIIWITILFICFFYNITKYSFKSLLAVSTSLALVITMTHTLYALATACFICVLMLVRLIIQRKDFIKDKLSISLYSLTIFVLMIGPIITKLLPTRLSSNLMEIGGAPHYIIFGITIIQPTIIPIDVKGLILLIFGLFSIGYILIILRKNKLALPLALTLIFFYIFIAYTPVCAVLYRFIPLWTILRFGDLLVLNKLYIVVGLLAMCKLIYWMHLKEQWTFIKELLTRKKVIYAVFIGLVVAISALFICQSYEPLFINQSGKQLFYDNIRLQIEQNGDILKDNALVVTSPNFGYELSSVFQIDIISLSYGHAALASDGENRLACLNNILVNYSSADLDAVGAKYVVIDKDQSEQKTLLDKKPYLELVKDNFMYIYKYNSANKDDFEKPFQPCLSYLDNEKK